MNALHFYRRLWPYLRPYRARFFTGLVLGLLFAASQMALVALFQKVLRHVFGDAPQRYTMGYVFEVASLIPALFLVRGLCDYYNKYLMNWVGFRGVMDLRNRLFEHIHTLSLDFFNRTSVGDLISRITNDAVFVQRAVSGSLADLLKQPFVFLGLAAQLFHYDWKFSLAVMFLFPTCLVPVTVYGRKAKHSTRNSQENLSELVSLLNESFAGVRIVKAFCMERTEIEKFRASSKKLFRYFMRVAMSAAILPPLIELISSIGIVAAFIYAFNMHMSFDKFAAVVAGFLLMYTPVKALSTVHVALQSATAATDRIFQVLDIHPTVVEKPHAQILSPVRDTIEFDHVSFRYDKTVVLEDIHFKVPVGKLAAIVGTSGAGKSTLVNLIPRFYDVVDGAIRVDGVDIRNVTFRSLREHIGMVTQEVILFDDTVANNIAVGRPGTSREEIMEAAKRANAHGFIEQMPLGYDSEIGERGVRVSGGQRQRIAIARAILKNAPILILDEATSSLDSESEHAVQQALDELMQKRTSFVIAHRLSTVQHADLILVIDQGRIAESGRHEDLLARGGIYRRLHDMQFRE